MFRKSVFFAYLILLVIISQWPSRDLPDVDLFPQADKLIHSAMYAGFCFLLLWAWPEQFTGKKILSALFILLAFGLLMELMQGVSHAGRSFDITDELANGIGFIPGWILWKIVSRIQKPETTETRNSPHE
jgi:VanZ family protein